MPSFIDFGWILCIEGCDNPVGKIFDFCNILRFTNVLKFLSLAGDAQNVVLSIERYHSQV